MNKLYLKHFRCFDQFEVSFTHPIALLIGPNGSGKTSIMESLHYACYLRSFRTAAPKDLIGFGQESFFIRVGLHDQNESRLEREIQIGFAGQKKLVKVDQKPIKSYKELNSYYRVITVTQDDIALIKGIPEARRTFIDQAQLLHEQDYLQELRAFKQALKNRNALLRAQRIDKHSYDIWTKQLWHHSRIIQKKRITLLQRLQKRINQLLHDNFALPVTISLDYQARKKTVGFETLDDFLRAHPHLAQQEQALGRSFFGAHLDDIVIHFEGNASKLFASRGQQKFIIFLLKIAQIIELTNDVGNTLFLLDDFMTDFDEKTGSQLLSILATLPLQLIFTTPVNNATLVQALKQFDHQVVNLTC